MRLIITLFPFLLLIVLITGCTSQNSRPLPTQRASQPTATLSSEFVPYTVEAFVSNLNVPWSIVFAGDDRIYITERSGSIRLIEKGTLVQSPLIRFSVSGRSEEGLMGLALDPDYERNKYVYACYAYSEGSGIADRVVRMIDDKSSFRLDKTIIEGIPAAQYHAGCRLAFGPDKKLYITTGDATQRNLAQSTDSLAGKILRVNADGSIPQDNPFPDSPIWSLGHRNPQGIAWHPVTGALWSTEHGPSGNDGPGGGDEVNVVGKGENYGWPIVSHDKQKDGLINPQIIYTPAIAPASGTFYTGTIFPQLRNNFLYGGLRGEGIYRAVISENGASVVTHDKLPNISVGRVRDVVTGPDGYIYFSSSNRDGRGKIRTGDDTIYRLVPAQ